MALKSRIRRKLSEKPVYVTRLRAARTDDHRKECERRLAAFGLFAETFDPHSDVAFALRIARALRAERRAARMGAGYDPMRHFVLMRLDKRLKRRMRAKNGPNAA